MFCCCKKKKNKSKETKSPGKKNGKTTSTEVDKKTHGSGEKKTTSSERENTRGLADPLVTRDNLSAETDIKGTMKKKEPNDKPTGEAGDTMFKMNDRTVDGMTTMQEKDDEICLDLNLKGYTFDNQVPLRNFSKWCSIVVQVYDKKIEISKDKEDAPVVTLREIDDSVHIDLIIFNKLPVRFTAKKEKINLVVLVFDFIVQAYSAIKTRIRNFKLVLEKGFDNGNEIWSNPFFTNTAQFMNVSIYNRSDHVKVSIPTVWLQNIPTFYTQCISLECIKCFNNGHLNSIHFRSIWISECEVTEKGVFQFIKNWVETKDKEAYKHLRMDVSVEMENKIMDNLKKNIPGVVSMKDDKEMEEKVKAIYKRIACKAAHDERFSTKFDGFNVYFICKTKKSDVDQKEKKYVATIGVKKGVFEFCYCGDVEGTEDGADSIFTSFRGAAPA